MTNDILIGFVSSVPIWSVLGFFLLRTIKNRDDFEKKFSEEMQSIKLSIVAMSKDIEHAINLSKTVSEMSERTAKLKYDIDNCFAKMRQYEETRN